MAGEPQEQNQDHVTVQPDVALPDNGLSAEESAQFDAMRAADSAPPPADVEQKPEGEAKPEGQPDAAKPDPAKPDAAAKPEGSEDDDDDAPEPGKDGQRVPRRVSMKKHQTEIERRDAEIKALREADAQRIAERAKLEERLAIINEALTPKQPQPGEGQDDDPEPDPNEDFIAHALWQSRENKRLRERLDAMASGLNEGTAERQIAQAYGDDAVMFAQREPSFTPAYQFLMNSRVVELAEYFYGKDLTAEGAGLTAQEVNKIRQTIQNEERDLVAGALRANQSPAQRIYRLAVARGFRKEAAAAKPNGEAKQNGSAKVPGNLADAASGAEKKPNVSEEIERIKSGVESSTSLTQAGGAPGITLTPEKLANMPQEEFAALMDQLTEGEQRRLLGGA